MTLAIAIWKFRSWLGLQFPKWKLFWVCGGSFPHILPQSQEHEMWFLASLSARTFTSPSLGHEPKARVAIILVYCNVFLPTVDLFLIIVFFECFWWQPFDNSSHKKITKNWMKYFLKPKFKLKKPHIDKLKINSWGQLPSGRKLVSIYWVYVIAIFILYVHVHFYFWTKVK